MSYTLALDQGTSSSRSIVFDVQGQIVGMAQQELPQLFPQPGWVEHDPMAIWQSQLDTARQAIAQAQLSARDIRAIGITNQRETTVVWNKLTGQPIHHALVWQDRRTEAACMALRQHDKASAIRFKTGLVIDPYFSATKVQWLLDNVPGARAQAERGLLLFGTIDCWLIWQLTGGADPSTRAQARHVTDVSNASRTLLFNVHTGQWDPELLQLLGIPATMLPTVLPSASDYGQTQADLLGQPIAIGGVAGDQQSALFGQACFTSGMAKNTYGTGCFMLMHTGDQFLSSDNGLITTRAAQTSHAPAFALEGSVFMGGAVVQWLRDGLQAIEHSAQVQALAESVPDAGGVVLVPAFTGLGAPYWQAQARGSMTGLSRGTTLAHIARAALDAIAFQSAALLQAMSRDALARGADAVSELRVDGGACANDLLMQIQADLLGVPVIRPAVIETTALGAAYLAGLTSGLYGGLDELREHWRLDRCFEPKISRDEAQSRMDLWERAVRQTLTP